MHLKQLLKGTTATALVLGAAVAFSPGGANASVLWTTSWAFDGGPAALEYTVTSEALFTFDNGTHTLTINLRNTTDHAAGKQDVAATALTAVFFSLPTGGHTYTKSSVYLATGSNILHPGNCDLTGSENGDNATACNNVNAGATPAARSLGGEFAFNTTDPDIPAGTNMGVSSAGLGIFAPSDLFDTSAGAKLDKPDDPDGENFSIVSKDPDLNLQGVLADEPIIQNEVVIVLSYTGDLSDTDLTNVLFNYSTSLSTQPGVPPPPHITVAEPATLAALGSGLVFMGLGTTVLRRRRDDA